MQADDTRAGRAYGWGADTRSMDWQTSHRSRTESLHKIGELLEVNDRGVAVAHTDTQHRRRYGGFPEEVHTDEMRFYPWEQVSVIRYIEQEQDAG